MPDLKIERAYLPAVDKATGEGSARRQPREETKRQRKGRSPAELALLLSGSGSKGSAEKPRLRFSADANGRLERILVVDGKTGETILELTPEEMTALARESQVFQGVLLEKQS